MFATVAAFRILPERAAVFKISAPEWFLARTH
jgi:hypothetical protein